MEPQEQPQMLPPPPLKIPPNVVPIRVEPAKNSSIFEEKMKPKSSKGKKVSILTNHFKVTMSSAMGDFYHYNILFSHEDGRPIAQKNTKLAVIEKLYDTYKTDFSAEKLVYDGFGSLFTLSPLPQNNLDFSVVLNSVSSKGESDQKRQRLNFRPKIFKVEMSFVSIISMQSVNESLRVLDTVVRQRALKQGCLVLRQSFFANETSNFIDLGGGVLGCRGFFSSFKALQGGLYLNHDVSMTTIIQPGTVVDFLIRNQNVKTPLEINWSKAIGTLKNLRFKVKHLNREFKITGLSDRSCKEQKFSVKLGDITIETSVYDYFVSTRGIALNFSADLPCVNAGKPDNPMYFPVELCFLVPLQRYTNELTVYQRSAMITKSSQKPEDLIKALANAVKSNNYEAEPLLQSCGVSINTSLVQVEGRVLSPPTLKMGSGDYIVPRNARWNIKDKKFVEPKRLEHWSVVNFSTHSDVRKMCVELAKIASTKGMVINPPLCVLEENPKHRKKPPSIRVEMIFQQMQSKFRQNPPRFILCFLSDKKSSDLYGPWKMKTLVEFGIPNQCISSNKTDEIYLMNVLMKINVKLGGFNHFVLSESIRTVPFVSKIPTMIFGIHVSHAAPGRVDIPSIAAVVGSKEWPRISSYRASLRALSPKTETIDSLFKPVSQQEDAGIIRELLKEFYASSGQKKPAQMIIFRNGLCTSQFDSVLKVEMEQILKACNFLEKNWRPKFTLIVAQRRHHTKFFDANLGTNILPGTIVDNKVCDLQSTNFYMCPHTSRIGTARPIHYHVLLDEIGFSSDDLQELIHSLSYAFQRSNSAISEVAPVRYARLAAMQMSQVIKSGKTANTSESYVPGFLLQ
ncbi:hypothetical protein BUALT_Bualt07G0013300 [Buddleja alternifolia]|uniref:Argonaute 4 n=1 Tax=Buddleja alternifolia TaxID=168488 RepID=A0AAV6X871_9LAMI|nr:hypothetical protein BUALT_Bualt07G0013300 [Buddleja alternifolia]